MSAADQRSDIERVPRDALVRQGFERTPRGENLVATEETARAAGTVPAVRAAVKSFFLGRPLDSEAEESESLSVLKALPILSSDALSSVAYGPEASLAVLVAAGAGALVWNVPLMVAVGGLVVVVTISYRQIVRGYPQGGGSYNVAKDMLAPIFGLVAAAALFVDYTLAVAVGVSSGVDSVASAFPVLTPWVVPLCLLCILVLMAINLRGLREAGTVFAAPTYIFLLAMLLVLVAGFGGLLMHRAPTHFAPRPVTESLSPFLLLTAFASGCSSLTGIEAIADTVPSFRPPESRNAARTLSILGSILVILVIGIGVLAFIYHAEPFASGNPTVLSQIAKDLFTGPLRFLFYFIQFSTFLILVLCANTGFNGFPRLAAVLAHDRYVPMRFGYFGDRLVFSTAIVLLAVVTSLLIVAFKANTDDLINLFALGVFTAFTIAQSAMAWHWWQAREPGWRRSLAINTTGAVVTAVVGLVIVITKTPRGAWIVLIAVPLLVLAFIATNRYYRGVESRLADARPRGRAELRPWVVVPFSTLDKATETALAYAGTLSDDVRALHLFRGEQEAGVMRAGWEQRWAHWPGPAPTLVQERRGPLLVQLGGALTKAVRRLEEELPGPPPETQGWLTTVVLPEWERQRLASSALSRPQIAYMKWILARRFRAVVATPPARGAGGATGDPEGASPGAAAAERVAIVPILNLDPPAMRALDYASRTAEHVIALHVEVASALEEEEDTRIADDVAAWRKDHEVPNMRIVIIESPTRLIVEPVLAYVDTWRRAHPEPVCTVVIPELHDAWWSAFLHNHRGLWLKAALLLRENVAVADIIFHLPRGAGAPSAA